MYTNSVTPHHKLVMRDTFQGWIDDDSAVRVEGSESSQSQYMIAVKDLWRKQIDIINADPEVLRLMR